LATDGRGWTQMGDGNGIHHEGTKARRGGVATDERG